MSKLLEITGNDIAKLNDSELRVLIGLLCEADYRRANYSTKGITWGGKQDAADGGLDVVIHDEIQPPEDSFILRSHTGFQVKKPDMSKSKIIPEMRPKGELRESIKDLIANKGAYIIASSSANTTDSALKDRIKAMKEAVEVEDNHNDLKLDFYDRNRIASWVRSHPFMVLWVRNRIGRQLKGWQPYENWSNPKAGTGEEYLIDDRLRLHDGIKPQDESQSVKEGIQKLRAKLSVPGSSVRMTGLSGVGKTRLVQALFDGRIGENALNHSLAFYTDISDGPDPDPKTFAKQLIYSKTRAILIVDNCKPELHQQLTKTCSSQESTVSLLTVEYDVRDDLPDETSVFRLEPSSDDLIEKIILNRFEHISQVDAQTIAKFSGGNARVAISLANTINHGESISGLRDEDLFKRLFQQRHDSNENLLISAQVCSLVYSFEGMDAVSEESELKFLSFLAGKTINELYRDIATLKKRDLVQSRHVWRAVLPHAISNRLARLALESIPKDTIVTAFIENGSERLIKSFARRLSYLHDCKQAVEIVNEWLSPDGYLGEANCNFNDFGMEVFRNVAPVSPEKTLEMVKNAANGDNGNKFTSKENEHYLEFVRLLRHIAYDSALFDRSVDIMCRFALSEDGDENNDQTKNTIKSLFFMHLSGTQASIEERAKVINDLVDSEDNDRQKLGLFILDATLETWHFSSSHDFSFGARPRDFGYYPKTREEYINWFETFIGICGNIALSGKPVAGKAQKIISDKMRGLWSNAHMYDVLEKLAAQIHKQYPWNEGWIAVRGIIKYDRKGMEKDVIKRLYKLEDYLKPDNLLERARTYALLKTSTSFELEEDYDDDNGAHNGWEEVVKKTVEIGIEVAKDSEVLNKILPEFFTPGLLRLRSFGKGLAIGYSEKNELWHVLRSQFEKSDHEKRHIGVLLGYLSGMAETDPELYNSTLDGLIEDELLGEWFPDFQATAKIDKKGVERLNKALDIGNAKVENFHTLAYGENHDPISDNDLSELLKNILSKDGGMSVTIEILKMRFFRPKDETPEYSEKLLEVGRNILSRYAFSKDYGRNNGLDYGLAQIAKVCLTGEKGINAAKEMCNHFVKIIIEDSIFIPDHPQLFGTIASSQPFVLLDTFLGDDKIMDYKRRRIFNVTNKNRANPLNHITDGDMISWCEIDPGKRYEIISTAIQGFKKPDEKGNLEWRPIVKSIFENAPDLGVVLDNITATFIPSSWSGSRADIMQKRSELLKKWFHHENEEIRSLAKNKYTEFQKFIRNEREREEKWQDRTHESFE